MIRRPPRSTLCAYASPFRTTYARARALMARQWSARCYGVARQREGSRQNSIGGNGGGQIPPSPQVLTKQIRADRKDTRPTSNHLGLPYAVCPLTEKRPGLRLHAH